jgi:GWxTD domain-containing protein
MTFQIHRLGWTLLHFLWQGTAIAVVHAIVRSLFGGSAQRRYLLACAALAAMVAAPPLTWLALPNAGMGGLATWSISSSAWERLLPAIVASWLAGVLVFSVRLLGAWRFTARLRSTSHPAPAEWQVQLERIARSLFNANQRVSLMISSLVDVPTVVGWLRPAILVPVEFLTGFPFEHIEALLAHELAHIRRRDYLASLLQSVAEAVLFYHPAVWWISEQIRSERELCCDDMAVTACGDVLVYARALAQLEALQPPRLNSVVAANGGSLVSRIRRLIEPAHPGTNNLPGPAAAWAMIVLWIAGAGVSAVHAAQTPVSAPPVVNTRPAYVPPPPSPVTVVASHARKTLLFDPFLSAQLAQAAPRDPDLPGTIRLETPWQKWLNEDVVYIITDEERRAFRQLNTDAEREQFVEQFWLRRDPTPDTIENEYKEEQYRRIAYANQRFSSIVPGWKTDRGRIYIIFGPPDEIDSHPTGGTYERPAAEGGGVTTTFPFEDWRYRYIQGMGDNILIEFVDTAKTGEYHMTMDPLEKEVLPARAALSGNPQAGNNQFGRLRQFAQLQATPQSIFKDLEAAMGAKPTGNVLPLQLRIDYVPATESATIANITVQFENRDLQFQTVGGVGKAIVNLLGRITATTGRPATVFEKSLEIAAPSGMLQQLSQQRSLYQQSVPLPPGSYRLNIVAKDVFSGNLNSYEVALDVPQAVAGVLSSSSLILADVIERVPATALGGSMFQIGGDKVRPRLGNKFTSGEKVGIYLQVYNFKPDEKTEKPAGSIEYEIDRAVSNERVMNFSEELASIPNAAARQVTIEKMLPLRMFEPGAYLLRVTAVDRNGKHTLSQQASFTVAAD